MPIQCARCGSPKFAVRRMRTGLPMCKECFLLSFEEEVHQTIVEAKLFHPGQIVAIGVSGGKGISFSFELLISYLLFPFQDSTCLLHVLDTLNKRYNYGIDIRLIAIDEGIAGYRDFSLKVCLFFLFLIDRVFPD